jgi:calcium/calmodulin-dependent protein kinase I
MAQLLLALDWMHRKNILHRDIKPDNILVTDGARLTVCITDLGMACTTNDEQTKLCCGTPCYIAPESLNGKVMTPKSDIFSLGSIFFNLVTLKPLFQGRCVQEILNANRRQNPKLLVRLLVKSPTKECKSLLSMMLDPNPDSRPSAEQCLQHSWF